MNGFPIIDMTGVFLLALITGGMFFFAAIMTPLVFTKLPPETSGPFIRQAFPVYSMAMAGMTLAAALPGGARVLPIKGAAHGFQNELEELAARVTDAIPERLRR